MRFASVVIGALVAQTVTTALVVGPIGPSAELREWYRALGASAMALDVLSLAVGTYVGMRLAPDSVFGGIAGAVGVQLVHDVLFGLVVRAWPEPTASVPMRLFRAYAEAKGGRIVFDDALMMAGCVVATHALRRVRDAEVVGAAAAYLNLLMIHSM